MDKPSKYTVESAKRRVSIHCRITGNRIKVGPGTGIKTFGAIDFLVKQAGFTVDAERAVTEPAAVEDEE